MRFRQIALFAAALICVHAYAKDVYIAQAAAGLQDGSSCANAQSVAWFNRTSGQIAPGDTVHLCGVISTMVEPKDDGISGSPITIVFEKDAKISAPSFWVGVRQFGTGINLDKRHFYIVDGGQNGTIEATSNGTPGVNEHSDDISGVDTDRAGDITIHNLTITGMYRRTPYSHDANKYGCGSWGGSMTGTNIFENNTVTDANCGVQWNTDNTQGGTMIVRNNSISRVSWGFASGGGGPVRLQFYGNQLFDGYVWSGQIQTGDGHFHNDPFHIWTTSSTTSFQQLAVYNNWVFGDWGDNSTGAFYFECQGPANDCPALIYNNIVSSKSGFTNGAVALKYAEHVRIFNNVFASPGNAIQIEDNTLGDTSTPTRYVDVENNLFYGVNTPMALNDNSTYGTVDHNAYWDTSVGNDAHKITGNPKVDSNFVPAPGSPLIGQGVNLSAYFTVDRVGSPRPSSGAWTIGAYEGASGSGSKPAAPPRLTATPK
jgi:hypothetical protein